MMVKTWPWQRGGNGSLIMVVRQRFLLGESSGLRYLECTIRKAAIQCPRNFGYFLTFSSCVQASLLFSQISPEIVGDKLGKEHLYDAVNVILSLQSNNGGFLAWESARAYRWLEFQKFNPTEFFEDTLIEHEYVECTSSAVHALALYKKLYPEYRKKEIKNCIVRAIRYIEDAQNPDGSWYGCWGICFTYGTWFAAEGLVACGWNYHNSPSIHKTCEFLLSKQLPRGGWGELSFKSKQGRCIQI